MKRDPFKDLLVKLLGNEIDPRSCLLDPFHPATLFCVLCTVVGMVVVTLLRGGG